MTNLTEFQSKLVNLPKPGDLKPDAAFDLLRSSGEVTPRGWIPAPDISPIEWEALAPAIVALHSGSQWLVASWVEVGRKWNAVAGVELSGGRLIYEEEETGAFLLDGKILDAEYDEDRGIFFVPPAGEDEDELLIAPFSYSAAASITGYAEQTLYNMTSVLRRFSIFEPESKLYPLRADWAPLLFSHFAAVVGRDLPDERVESWLTSAAAGGWTVEDLQTEVRNYRDERTEETAEHIEKSGGEAPKGLPLEVALDRDAPKIGRAILASGVALSEEDADAAGRAAVRWFYESATDDVLRGALAYKGSER